MPPSVAIPNNNNHGGSNANNNGRNSATPSRGGGGRPSDGRRQRLNDELSVPVVSNFFPIERYYEAAQKVYNMVLDTYEADLLDDTYLYGKRYCTFVLDAIPKHNYYNSKQDTKYKQYKVLHTKQVTVVLDLLEQVATKMDAEEIQKQKEYEIAIAKQQLHDAQIAQEKINQFQQRMQQQQQQNKKGSSGSSELTAQSALSKLALLQQQQQQPKYDTNKNEATSSTRRIRQDPSGLGDGTSNTASSRTRYKLSFSDEDDSDNDNDNNTLPPPLLPPPLLPPDYYDGTEQLQPPPPPYTAVASSSSSSRVRNKDNGEQQQQQQHSDWKIRLPVDDDNNNDDDDDGCNNKNSNSYDGNHYHAPTTNSNRKSSSKQRLVVKQPIIPMKTLQQQYYEQYVQYQKNGRISVSYLDTYQGRNYDSTNGCTVISALVAAYHLRSNTTTNNNNNELPNSTICTIIDQKCGPILREIRTKLGLSGHALIIPSDVHDHFVDAKIFTQNQFVGAAGGNICDRNHYGEFLKLLYFGSDSNNKDKSKKFQKASATLFFREHVISIIKIPIISSSSNSTTKNNNNNNNTNSCYYDLIDSLPGGSIGKATRTRCTDMQSLECLLQYYTTRKFSDSNCSYIDKNPWDDTMADIDPRVFQGFVWAENATTTTTNSQ